MDLRCHICMCTRLRGLRLNPFGSRRTVRQINKVKVEGLGLNISYLSIYIPWPFPPVWGVADNTKEQQKQWVISLRSSSDDEGPSRVYLFIFFFFFFSWFYEKVQSFC